VKYGVNEQRNIAESVDTLKTACGEQSGKMGMGQSVAAAGHH